MAKPTAKTGKTAKATKIAHKKESSASCCCSPEQQIEDVSNLIRLMSETGLAELEMETTQLKVSLRKHAHQVVASAAPVALPAMMPALSPIPAGGLPMPTPKPGKAASEGEKKDVAADTKYHKIVSPMAGTFYSAPSPNSPPYVKEGDDIEAGKPVCIVEAMKLMNEIKADKAGKIIKVMVKNSQPVEKGTVLFHVEPK